MSRLPSGFLYHTFSCLKGTRIDVGTIRAYKYQNMCTFFSNRHIIKLKLIAKPVEKFNWIWLANPVIAEPFLTQLNDEVELVYDSIITAERDIEDVKKKQEYLRAFTEKMQQKFVQQAHIDGQFPMDDLEA